MLHDELLGDISKLPVIDVHSHMFRDRLHAWELGIVLFYHMVQYPLRAAGVDELKLWPPPKEGGFQGFHGHGRPFEELFAHWDDIQNTSFAWMLRYILRELYGFDEPVTAASLPKLQAAFDANTGDPQWSRKVLAKAGLVRTLSSAFFRWGPNGRSPMGPLPEGMTDGGLRYTVEMAPLNGTRESSPWLGRFEQLKKHLSCEVRTMAQMRDMCKTYYNDIDWSDKHAYVNWISSHSDFTPVKDEVIDAILADVWAGKEIDARAARLLEAATTRAMLQGVRGKTRVFQMCYGIQFQTTSSPARPMVRSHADMASTFTHLVSEFPDLHFNILNGYEADEPILCSLVLAHPNVSLGGYWWATFYPSVMKAAWRRRLEMLPVTSLCGFFSDGYSVDWSIARLHMCRKILSEVLAEKVEQGYYTRSQAVKIAESILYKTPQKLFLPEEQIG